MYKAILFSPNGEFVTDFMGKKTIQEVWDCINDMGSRWFFYPIAFVAIDKTIIDTCDLLDFLKNKRIKTAQKFIQNNTKEIINLLAY